MGSESTPLYKRANWDSLADELSKDIDTITANMEHLTSNELWEKLKLLLTRELIGISHTKSASQKTPGAHSLSQQTGRASATYPYPCAPRGTRSHSQHLQFQRKLLLTNRRCHDGKQVGAKLCMFVRGPYRRADLLAV